MPPVCSRCVTAVGDVVEADEVVAVLETDKVSVDIRSSSAGTLTKVMAEEGDTVAVGDNLFEIDTSAAAAKPAKKDKKDKPTEAKSEDKSAKKEEKVAEKTESKAAAKESKESKKSAAPSAPTEAGQRTETRVPMSRMRQRIAQRLQESQTQTASLTTFQECDMSGLMEVRHHHHVDHVLKQMHSSVVRTKTRSWRNMASSSGSCRDL